MPEGLLFKLPSVADTAGNFHEEDPKDQPASKRPY
jgi:hypothetical protein